MRSRYVGRRLFGDAAGAMEREVLANMTPEEVYPEHYAKGHAGQPGGPVGN